MTLNRLALELDELVNTQCEGALTDEQAARIEELVAGNAELRRDYVTYLHVHACAERDGKIAKDRMGSQASAADVKDKLASSDALRSNPSVSVPPFVIQVSLPPGLAPNAVHDMVGYTLQTRLLSYLVAAAIFAIGLWFGSYIHTSRPEQVANLPGRSTPSILPAKTESVGRITGLVDCVWGDPKTKPVDRDPVSLGRQYVLASGFMEIAYDSGAKVILEGPAKYKVESADGGYLSLGKLTAQVAKKGSSGGDRGSGSKGERTANLTFSQGKREPTTSLAPRPLAGKSEIRNPKSPIPSPLFFVRTPTAIVTDLGTEFGVEVDRSGDSRAHVFRGKVEVRPVGDGSEENARMIPLGENESATVEAGRGPVVKVTRGVEQSNATRFVRQMPRQVRIKLFSTGVGLKQGDPDPHWQLVARSDEPNFKPRPAVVTVIDPRYYLANDPARSQWISTAGDLPKLPRGVYTFRTTFELADVLPETAVLQGWFVVDNNVTAVRLNGAAVSVPQHSTLPPFDQPHSFKIRKGFVAGTNVLEIDVFNLQTSWGEGTAMALAVELEGFAIRGQHVPRALSPEARTTDETKEGKGKGDQPMR